MDTRQDHSTGSRTQPAGRRSASSSTEANADEPSFSAKATDELALALVAFVQDRTDDRHEALSHALATLCREAHTKSLGPERMLRAVKETWTALAEVSSIDDERARIAFERVLNACLDAYYDEQP